MRQPPAGELIYWSRNYSVNGSYRDFASFESGQPTIPFTGACAAIAALWLAKCIRFPLMLQNNSRMVSPWHVGMATAVYYGNRSGDVEESLLAPEGLEAEEVRILATGSSRLVRAVLDSVLNKNGYYYIHMGGATPHAIAIVNLHGHRYLLDPTLGLFREDNRETFCNGNANFLTEAYPLCTGIWMIYKVRQQAGDEIQLPEFNRPGS